MNSVEDHLKEIERRVSLIREELSSSFRFEPDGLRVTITFSDINDPEVKYYNPSIHTAWQLKASDYITVESGMVIKVKSPGKWKFRLLDGGEAVTEKTFTLKENDTPDREILFGFWDSDHAPEDAPQNVKKLYWNNLDDSRVIPMIGGFTADMSESDIRKRLKNRRDPIDRVKDQVEYILLHDEPFYKNFTVGKLNEILTIAREELPGHKFAYSFARGALRDSGDVTLPDVDVAMINNYTFYHAEYWPEMYLTTKAEFEADLQQTLEIIRSQISPEIVLTGQSIRDDNKYRQPPLESVQWNIDACYKFDLKGVIWFEYRDRSHWQGAGSMPEFYNEIKRVYEQL